MDKRKLSVACGEIVRELKANGTYEGFSFLRFGTPGDGELIMIISEDKGINERLDALMERYREPEDQR